MSARAAVSDGVAPTLELRQLAVRSAGAAWATPLSVRSDARRIGLVGDWEPLFQLLTGRAEASGGSAHILGCALESAISCGVLGFAACDALLPVSFTVVEYLRHAARLSHGSTRRAVHDAQRALDRYGLAELAKKKLAELALYQQRALAIALSTLTAPAVVCLEAPVHGLDAASADYIARLCSEAAAHSRVLLSAALPSSPSAERSLLDACDEVLVRRHDGVLTSGAPNAVFAVGASYSLSVKGPQFAAFCRALSAAGVRFEPRTPAGSLSVEIPEGGSTDLLLDAALEHGLIVLELEPLIAR
jgi:ABC-type cobalamin/Fe3+-siderophores transport system ATPase subunit